MLFNTGPSDVEIMSIPSSKAPDGIKQSLQATLLIASDLSFVAIVIGTILFFSPRLFFGEFSKEILFSIQIRSRMNWLPDVDTERMLSFEVELKSSSGRFVKGADVIPNVGNPPVFEVTCSSSVAAVSIMLYGKIEDGEIGRNPFSDGSTEASLASTTDTVPRAR
jgi:hypothetical protein